MYRKESTYGMNNLLFIEQTMDTSTTASTGNKRECTTCGCKDAFRDGVRVCGCDTCQKDGCIYKGCVTCGCKDEFRDGERVCWCDACQKDGCSYQEKEKEKEKSCACTSGGPMCETCVKANGYDDPCDGATYECEKCKTNFKNKYYNRSTFLCRACDVPEQSK